METSSLAQRLSTRFVAGETLDQALAVARKLNAEGITVTLDHLGESVSTLAEAAEARDVYLRTLDAIHNNGIQGGVSLKLTQFGLDLSYEQCLANVEQLVRRAAELGNFVRVDMESSDYTDRTLDLVHTLHERYRRGRRGDSELPVPQPGGYREAVRRENRRPAVQRRLSGTCHGRLPAEARRGPKLPGTRPHTSWNAASIPALATHDEAVIRQICQFVTERKISRDRFEFQMLYGIRRDLQRRLVAEGYRLRLYVPFGKAWYPYYMRRLAERPANVFFMVRNLFRQLTF